MTTSNPPRDVDLKAWLNKIAFHPANTEAKQLGHEYVRAIIAAYGASIHDVLPAGEDKSIVFRLLGEVLMYANRALAVGGGPVSSEPQAMTSLREMIDAGGSIFAWAGIEPDPRIKQYKAEQLDAE